MSGTIDTSEDLTPNDRRALLRKIAIGGAAACAVLLNNGRVSANNGDSVNAGETATSTVPTIIDFRPEAPTSSSTSSASTSDQPTLIHAPPTG